MNRDVIAMSKLGEMGRFGNQVIQYMFLKTYALQHDLEVQTPPWIGQKLFGCEDRPISASLPEFEELYDKDPQRMMIPRLDAPLRNVDVAGYFQYASAYYQPHQAYIRSLFTPVDAVRRPLEAAVARLRQRGRTIVALHIRRGDYGYGYFYRTPTSWYLRWLESVWSDLDDPVLYIASDDLPNVLGDFKSYSPVTVKDLDIRLRQAPFYPEFFLLSQADVLAIPNSTFSFVAAMLNEKLQAAYRSQLSDQVDGSHFHRFDPWNAPMLDTSARVEDFPQVQGIARPPRRKKFRPLRWLRSYLRERQAASGKGSCNAMAATPRHAVSRSAASAT
ncbi:alpha-1,2-fucosyltransferase [Lignipirellula cremea]|uniref:Glycosyl transferase family 11 n=1 Tax=Lignipirellula cremea TaxID=2528010 RepID=A0A518DUP4_9BACT|nr:alpha-1,2-fucosyltransferase [Lignipirellula cremea]QDU95561.1 hypothetical protein Pla8534_33760 [Lignipirellula cremea]